MNFGKILQVVSILLLICANSGIRIASKYQEEIIQETDSLQEENYFSCTCHGNSSRIEIPKYDHLKIYENLRTFGNYCKLDDKREVCMLYNECKNCSYHVAECHQNPVHKQYDCLKKVFKADEDEDTDNTTEILEIDENEETDKTTGPSESAGRFKREAYCPLPNRISTTYDLICKNYKRYVKCHQICIRGYTLKKGISRKRRCTYKQNQWKPTDFKECQPYVDCLMTQIRPGALECFTASTTEDAMCEVSCLAFGDEPATPKETFTCGISGRWNKELPPCVIPGRGLKLVPPPDIDPYPFLDDLLNVRSA